MHQMIGVKREAESVRGTQRQILKNESKQNQSFKDVNGNKQQQSKPN